MRNIFEQFDEAQLLALIEGTLEPRKQKALRAKLESNPKAKMALLRMCDDRAVLQTIPEPELPRDFLADLESILARPMLIETTPAKPGEYRRRHRRAVRRQRLPRLAVAAALLLAVSGGIWASSGYIAQGITQIAGLFSSEDPPIVKDESLLAPSTPDLDDAMVEFSAEVGVLHHYQPQLVSIEQYAFVDHSAQSSAESEDSAEALPRISTTLALVFETDHAAMVEKAMRDLLPSLKLEAAVVRNFTTKSNVNIGSMGRRDASVDANMPEGLAGYTPLSVGQVDGRRDYIPSRQEQQRFFDLGASHTFSVRSSHLGDLLGYVDGLKEFSSRLQFLPERVSEEPIMAGVSPLGILRQRREIQKALAALRGQAENPVIMLPVMVKQRPGE